MKRIIFILTWILIHQVDAQFSQEGYTTSLVSGVSSGTNYDMIPSTGTVSGIETSGGDLIHYTGFVPAHLINFTYDLEKQALLALYNQAGGDEWNNNGNWNTDAPIGDWQGIDMSNRRVSAIVLSSNNLVGAVPQEIADLPLLDNLVLADNELISVPDLSGVSFLDISNNKLNFSNLIPNIHGLYDPQKLVGVETFDSVYVDENLLLGVYNFSHPENSYQWKKGTDIMGATSNEYLISPMNYDNQGIYQVSVTNPNVPGLVLVGESRHAVAVGDLTISIVDFLNAEIGSGDAALMPVQETVGAFDTAYYQMFPSGSLVFERTALDDYIIGVDSDDPNQMPSYYSNTFLWEEADTLLFRERDRTITITVTSEVEPPQPGDGEGVISGFLDEDIPDDGRILARRRAAKVRCNIRRNTGGGRDNQDTYVLVSSVETNDNGEFLIEFLPAGQYRINFEYPGVPMDPNSFVEFVIGEDRTNFRLAAVITDDGIIVEDITILGFLKSQPLHVYPNPTKGVITIDHGKLKSQTLLLKIYDMDGRVMKSEKITNGMAEKSSYDLTDLEAGIYLVELDNGDKRMTFRLILK